MTIFIHMIKIFIVYYMDQAIQFIDNDNNKIIYLVYQYTNKYISTVVFGNLR